MTRAARIVSALVALLVSALFLVACGGVPGNSVAQVGDDPITKAKFDKYLEISAKSGQQVPGQKVVVPDPPTYRKCIANLREQLSKAPKGQPKPATSALRKQCKANDKNLREQTLGRLIQAEWVEGEAKDQNVKVTDAQVRKRFDEQKKQSFPREKDFTAFLKTSGMSLNDILDQVRLDLLASKLRDKVVGKKKKVTDAQVARYYEKNASQFGTPERRDIRLVLTRSKAKADAAKKALDKGTSFKAVVKKYSSDAQTKSKGGLLQDVPKGQGGDAQLEAAAFTAKKGKVLGPVKGQFGYYVFRVEKITKKTQQPLSAVRASIRQQVIAQNQQKQLAKFVKKFQKKWTAKTDCRKGYKVEGCKGVKPKKTTQQQQQGQQVPQQGQQVPQQGQGQGAQP